MSITSDAVEVGLAVMSKRQSRSIDTKRAWFLKQTKTFSFSDIPLHILERMDRVYSKSLKYSGIKSNRIAIFVMYCTTTASMSEIATYFGLSATSVRQKIQRVLRDVVFAKVANLF